MHPGARAAVGAAAPRFVERSSGEARLARRPPGADALPVCAAARAVRDRPGAACRPTLPHPARVYSVGQKACATGGRAAGLRRIRLAAQRAVCRVRIAMSASITPETFFPRFSRNAVNPDEIPPSNHGVAMAGTLLACIGSPIRTRAMPGCRIRRGPRRQATAVPLTPRAAGLPAGTGDPFRRTRRIQRLRSGITRGTSHRMDSRFCIVSNYASPFRRTP